MDNGKKLSDNPIIVLIGVVASVIAIFVFITGKENVPEIINNNSSSPQQVTPSSDIVLTPTQTAQPVIVLTPTQIVQPVSITNESFPNNILTSAITFDPMSPAYLKPLEEVDISFRYSTNEKDGVRILVRPVTNGQLSPNYMAHGSPIYPAGEGEATGYFTFEGGTVIVDQILIYMKSADWENLLAEVYIDVNYTFTP